MIPVILPMATGILLILFRRRLVQQLLSLLSGLVLLVFVVKLTYHVYHGGIVAVQSAGWPAPFGITFVADMLACVMLCLSAIIGFCAVVYSFATTDEDKRAHFYFPFLQFLFMGVNGTFLTGDIFNLFVFYELMLLSSYILMGLGSEKDQLRESFKYMSLNLVGAGIFLAAIGLLYAVTGTLNMADLSVRIAHVNNQYKPLLTVVSVLFLCVFAMKAACFPLYFWLPDSYPVAPYGVNAYFAGLLTKVGVYSLLRVFSLIFVTDVPFTHNIILALSGFTMLLGVMGALSQWEFRKILSFHIISQVGYMIMGIGIFTPFAIAGTIFYVVHHIIVKSSLFLASGIAMRICGTTELKDMGGIIERSSVASYLFMIPALSLAGVPPFSGFLSKFLLVRASIEASHPLIAAIAIITSLLTLYSMGKIWSYAYWGKGRLDTEDAGRKAYAMPSALFLPAMLLVSLTVMIGLYATPLLQISTRASEQLMDPQQYIGAVLMRAQEAKLHHPNPTPSTIEGEGMVGVAGVTGQ
jgi:multicomponent Na+:H+ antiporter subunit D